MPQSQPLLQAPVLPPANLAALDWLTQGTIHAYNIRQTMAAMAPKKPGVSMNQALAHFANLQNQAAQIPGMEGEHTRTLVDQFKQGFFDTKPFGSSSVSAALGSAVKGYTGNLIGTTLLTNTRGGWNAALTQVGVPAGKPLISASIAPLKPTAIPTWEGLRKEFGPVPRSATLAPTLSQFLAQATPTHFPASPQTPRPAPQPIPAIWDRSLFPPPVDYTNALVAGGGGSAATPRTVIQTARHELGRPYVWGAAGPARFDCSGLMQWVFARHGVNLPRTTEQQFGSRHPTVPWQRLQPGDSLYFHIPGGQVGANHTGLYIGKGQMIVAPHTGANVQVQNLNPYWRSTFVGAKRFTTR